MEPNPSPLPGHNVDALAQNVPAARPHHREALWVLKHTIVNTAVFIVIGAAAVLLDWLVHKCSTAGINPYLCMMLEGAALMLAAIDLVGFVRLQLRLMSAFFKSLPVP